MDVFVRGFLFVLLDFVTFAFRRCRIDISLRAARRCKYHDYRPGARDGRGVVLYSPYYATEPENCGKAVLMPYNKSALRKLEIPATRDRRYYMSSE